MCSLISDMTGRRQWFREELRNLMLKVWELLMRGKIERRSLPMEEVDDLSISQSSKLRCQRGDNSI